jgi:hypothetical protein
MLDMFAVSLELVCRILALWPPLATVAPLDTTALQGLLNHRLVLLARFPTLLELLVSSRVYHAHLAYTARVLPPSSRLSAALLDTFAPSEVLQAWRLYALLVIIAQLGAYPQLLVLLVLMLASPRSRSVALVQWDFTAKSRRLCRSLARRVTTARHPLPLLLSTLAAPVRMILRVVWGQ